MPNKIMNCDWWLASCLFLFIHITLYIASQLTNTHCHTYMHMQTHTYVCSERQSHAMGTLSKVNIIKRTDDCLCLSHIMQREEWECFTRICETDSADVCNNFMDLKVSKA